MCYCEINPHHSGLTLAYFRHSHNISAVSTFDAQICILHTLHTLLDMRVFLNYFWHRCETCEYKHQQILKKNAGEVAQTLITTRRWPLQPGHSCLDPCNHPPPSGSAKMCDPEKFEQIGGLRTLMVCANELA